MKTGSSQSRAGFSMVLPGPLQPNSSAKIARRACYLIPCLTLIGSIIRLVAIKIQSLKTDTSLQIKPLFTSYNV